MKPVASSSASWISLMSSLVVVVVVVVLPFITLECSAEHPQMITGNINVTTFVGDTITLPCEVENLGRHHVNWLKIGAGGVPSTLTVGYHQFSRNMRYRVARLRSNNQEQNHPHERRRIESWNFEIRKVQPTDQGLYQCYIKLNSKHKISAQVRLIVRSASEKVKNDDQQLQQQQQSRSSHSAQKEYVVINGEMEKVNMPPNSWIKLRCNATGSLLRRSSSNDNHHHQQKQLGYHSYDLHWYKDGKLIEQDSRRLKKWVSSYDNSNYMELELYAVEPDDSGMYQCKRDNTILRNIALNVGYGNGAGRMMASTTNFTRSLLFGLQLIFFSSYLTFSTL
jgi:hypothetical protein